MSNEKLVHDLFGYIDGLKYSTESCLKLLESKNFEQLKLLLEQMKIKQEMANDLKDQIRDTLVD